MLPMNWGVRPSSFVLGFVSFSRAVVGLSIEALVSLGAYFDSKPSSAPKAKLRCAIELPIYEILAAPH